MTQTEFSLKPATRSQSEAILHTLQEHAPSWVAMPVLWRASGAFAVHSRVADLRKRGHQIENRVEVGDGGASESYYRLQVQG